MKSREEIIKDAQKLETPPANYNLIEIHCFLALKQLLVMYYNKQISPSNATKIKMQILGEYEAKGREFEFMTSMYQEHINNIRDTENARIKLHKLLNEEAKPVTEESLCEIMNVCMEIISKVFKGEFIQ